MPWVRTTRNASKHRREALIITPGGDEVWLSISHLGLNLMVQEAPDWVRTSRYHESGTEGVLVGEEKSRQLIVRELSCYYPYHEPFTDTPRGGFTRSLVRRWPCQKGGTLDAMSTCPYKEC